MRPTGDDSAQKIAYREIPSLLAEIDRTLTAESIGEEIMKALIPTLFAAFLPLAFALPAEGHEVPDPSIVHHAQDGVVRLYGAGGPDTAFRKVAEVFH
jgi:accessory colonization factor AcfC